MMRQLRALLSISFLMLGSQLAAAANSEISAFPPATHVARQCQPQLSKIDLGSELIHGLPIISALAATQAAPASLAQLPCIVASLHRSGVYIGAGNISIDMNVTGANAIPIGDTPPSSAQHLLDQTDTFEPSLVTAAGAAASETMGNFSINRSSPALALLALAIISMAAISRRPSGGPTANPDEI